MSEKPDVLLGEELSQSDVTTIENEIISGYRDFKVNLPSGDIDFRVYEPSNKEQELIANQYTEKYNELIKAKNLKLWEEILIELRERGIWKDEDDTKLDDLSEEISEVLKKYLRLIGLESHNTEMAEALKNRYFELKKKLDKFTDRKSTYYANSIESKANEYAIKFKLMFCLKKKNGEEFVPYFESIEQIDNTRNRMLVNRILKECLSFWAGIRQEYLSSAPEDDFFFGGNGLHTLLGDSVGESSTKSTKTAGKRSSVKK